MILRNTNSEKPGSGPGWLARLRNRGLFRVAFSYAVIAWLFLQIGDVVLDPLDAPGWVMRGLIVVVVAGFPVALLLAWYLELGAEGISVDRLPADTRRPKALGVRRYADIIIIGVLAGVIALLLARQGGMLEDDTSPPVIGVLPFTELGGMQEGYFGAGLADTLAYKLGLLKQILVLAPSSTRKFDKPGQDLKAVGDMLGATAVLEGTVRRASGSLKVNARLVNIASGQQIWAESFERPVADLFAVQDEIATAVVESLHLVLSPADAGRVTQSLTSSLSAYDAYLLGRARIATRDGLKMSGGVDYFRQAIRTDPDYALAHAALAEAIYLNVAYSISAPEWTNNRTEAQAAAARAQSLAPASGEGYLAQAFVAMGDNDFGDGSAWPPEYIASLLRKAVELSPNHASALKFYATYAGSAEEQLKLLQRAAQLDPRSGIIHMNLGDALAKTGDTGAALDHYLAAVAVSDGEFALSQMAIPFTLQFIWGRVDEAARWAQTLNRSNPNRDNTTALLRALLGLGAWEQVAATLDPVPTGMAPDDPILLRQRIVWALAVNDCGAVNDSVQKLEHKLTEMAGPDVTQLAPAVILEPARTAQGLCLVRSSRQNEAVHMLETANQELASLPFKNIAAMALRTQILLAALYKAQGRQEMVRPLLDELLHAAADVPVADVEGAGFSRFLALAVKGETELALAELQMVADLGWTADWWLLDALHFDPDYAVVQAEPRYQTIRTQLEVRVREMRENYLANPYPPAEQLQQVGLRAPK